MHIRPLLFWPHLIAGLLAGLVIVVMSVTGVLLTYERQLIAWSDSHLRSTAPSSGAARLSIEAVLERVAREHPGLSPTAVSIGAAPEATFVLTVPQRTLHLDAYTGQLLGEGSQGVRRLMSRLRAWHRWLAVEGERRPVARAITGWSNVLFLFIVVSGLYLWLPRVWRWQNVRAVLFFKQKVSGKARDFNWHHVIGVWSAVPLFIVVISAVPISFPWGNALVYRAVGEDPPAAGRGGREGAPPAEGRQGGAREGRAGEGGARDATPRAGGGERSVSFAGLNELWARAEQHVPGWRTINLRVPASERAPVVFAIDRGDGGQPHLRSTLTLERASGRVISDETFSTLTLGRRIRNTMRFAHTGEVLGIPGQTVAGLVTFGSLVLAWTGIALTLRRFQAWRRRRQSEQVKTRDATAA